MSTDRAFAAIHCTSIRYAATSSSPQVAYQLKITVLFTLPAVWRRFIVPSHISLAKLHLVVEAVMGWSDSSWHHFEDSDGNCHTIAARHGLKDSGETELAGLMERPGDRLMYHHGFEEDWEHNIELEAIIEPPRRPASAELLDGRGQCPPDDCGGPLGFRELLSVRSRRSRYRPLPSFRGGTDGPFDPEAFDHSAIAASLRCLKV